MGLQAMAQVRHRDVADELLAWVAAGDVFEMRAAAAAVAGPALLKRPEQIAPALEIHDRIMAQVLRIPAERRRSEDFVALRKGLGYTISVVAAAAPEEGFLRMHAWADLGDKDVRWILKENLGKNRLVRPFPERVKQLLDLL